jgi:hypothetical protein
MGSPDPSRRRRRRRATLVAARFADAAQARAAIEALQSAGIDGDDITLLSPFPEISDQSTRTADRRMVPYLAVRVVLGVVAGVAAGIVIGAAIGAVVIAVTTPPSPLGELAAFAVAGILIGAPLGAYIAFERAGTLSDAWSTTFEELEPGATWIGVRVHDPAGRTRARRTLERQEPAEVRELSTIPRAF